MQNTFRETKTDIVFTINKELNFPAHIHDDIELVFVKQGGGEAFCNGKTYTLKNNSFFIVFPNQVHHYINCKTGEYLLLIIKPDLLLHYSGLFLEREPVTPLNNNVDVDTINLIFTALKEFKNEGFSPIIDGYLTAFFGKLIKNYDFTKSKVTIDTTIKILDYCKKHYNENITVERVAKALKVSRSLVSHTFSNRLSVNFCDYINSLRLNNAKKLLDENSAAITEIAFLSGFQTIRTFNRAFYKAYGITPSEYKKKNARAFLDN